LVIVRQQPSGLHKCGHALDYAACGVDSRSDAIVGGAQDPAPVFGGTHSYDFQVLLVREAMAEVAVV